MNECAQAGSKDVSKAYIRRQGSPLSVTVFGSHILSMYEEAASNGTVVLDERFYPYAAPGYNERLAGWTAGLDFGHVFPFKNSAFEARLGFYFGPQLDRFSSDEVREVRHKRAPATLSITNTYEPDKVNFYRIPIGARWHFPKLKYFRPFVGSAFTVLLNANAEDPYWMARFALNPEVGDPMTHRVKRVFSERFGHAVAVSAGFTTSFGLRLEANRVFTGVFKANEQTRFSSAMISLGYTVIVGRRGAVSLY